MYTISKIDFMKSYPKYSGTDESMKIGDKIVVGFASGEVNYGTIEEILYDNIIDEISFIIPDHIKECPNNYIDYQLRLIIPIITVKCFGSEKIRKPHLKNVIKIDERFLKL